MPRKLVLVWRGFGSRTTCIVTQLRLSTDKLDRISMLVPGTSLAWNI